MVLTWQLQFRFLCHSGSLGPIGGPPWRDGLLTPRARSNTSHTETSRCVLSYVRGSYDTGSI